MRLLDFNVNDVIAQGLPISACLGILALAFAHHAGAGGGHRVGTRIAARWPIWC